MTERDEQAEGREAPGPTGEGIDRPRAWLTGVALGALILAALVIAFVIGTNYSEDAVSVAAEEEVPALPVDLAGPGKDLFVARCGACHMLADAGTTGTAGPDLDKLNADGEVIERAIDQGGTGSGMMPPGLATGDEAVQVSEYIVAATGAN